VVALVVNAGSTGMKLNAVDPDGAVTKLAGLDDVPSSLVGTGHRIVHGGARFRAPVLVTDDVVAQLEELVPLAPLHMRPALDALAEVRSRLPELPHVAVFDTAFHATLPPLATTYPLPERWREELGIRRYGFHGINLEWCAERIPQLLEADPDDLHAVVCHLGGGSSVTALRGGRSVDTTMGFSPLEGVPMGTRPGSIDVEIVLYLLRNGFATRDEIERDLNHASGLTALAGTGDVGELEDRAADDPQALFALELFAHRVAAAVAASSTSLGRLDVLAFTGGIGERGGLMRARICERLAHLGVRLDERANDVVDEGEIGAAGAPARIVVVRANEERVIARAVFALTA
jgi:acetate kinase